MGLTVSRLVTGCGKTQQCLNSTNLTFNKVSSVKLIEQEFDETILGNTNIQVCNLVEYFKNRKCTLQAVLKIGEKSYEVTLKDLRYCDKKLKIVLEKDNNIPEVCKQCLSIQIYSCVGEQTQQKEVLQKYQEKLSEDDQEKIKKYFSFPF